MHDPTLRIRLGAIQGAMVVFAALCFMFPAAAQQVPLLSGGAGIMTSTSNGATTYVPILEPLLAAPIGDRVLVESRAALIETFTPRGGGLTGYDHSHFIGLTYLQGDYLLSRHITVVLGSFLLPFNTYNERLSPVWISNFQDGPLIAGLGLLSTGTGVGGMLRGSAVSRPSYSLAYAAWFSTRSGNHQFDAERSTGGRVRFYLPKPGLEAGFSFDRQLQGARENFIGAHLWWEPAGTAFRLRSEFARGRHAEGYWVEGDYRLQALGGADSWLGRLEPLVRAQQIIRRDHLGGDGVAGINTQRADFGLDYNLPHSVRILTSYSRQYSAAGDRNIWEAGVAYRFLFPAWK